MEFFKRIKAQKGTPLLLGLMALGIFLFALSYMLPREETPARTRELAPSDLELRLCAVLSQIKGVGEVDVLVHAADSGEVVGVLVVAQGAQELGVRTELMRAAMTALDIPAKAVDVFAMDQEGGNKDG